MNQFSSLSDIQCELEKIVDEVKVKQIDLLDFDFQKYIEILQKYELKTQEDYEDASHVCLLISWLLRKKTKSLLPLDQEENVLENGNTLEEVREDFSKYEQLTMLLGRIEKNDEQSFTQQIIREFEEEIDAGKFLEGVTLDDLTSVFHEIMHRVSQEEVQDEDEVIFREEVNIQEQMDWILEELKKSKKKIEFQRLFYTADSKLRVIVTFLALLELIKRRSILVSQERIFGPIYVGLM